MVENLIKICCATLQTGGLILQPRPGKF